MNSQRSVFLSYASQDAEVAARIAAALSEAGVDVWFDLHALVGGDAWDNKIRKQVLECALFIPVISAHTDARDEGYFRIEWNLAAQRTLGMAGAKTFLLPVVVDATRDANALVPTEFKAVQWTHLPDGAHADAFAKRVSQLLNAPPAAAASPHSPESVQRLPGVSRRHNSWRWALAGIGAAVIGVAAAYAAFNAAPGVGAPRTNAMPASAGVPSIASDPSIAVLPFINMSSDKAQEFFSDGIAEELLNLLAKVPKLRVIARTSSFSFKGKQVDINEIAKKLNVAAVLEGSVRKSDNRVRITVQLIRASDSAHLWSETYDRTVDDIFKVQDEIAAAVVSQLKITLLGAAPTAKPIDPRAYALILQAKYIAHQGALDSDERAIALFRQALAIAPDAAAAWDGLTSVYIHQLNFGATTSTQAERLALALDAGNKALAANPDDALAHLNLGQIARSYTTLAEEAKHYQRALDLEPANLEVLTALSDFLLLLGREDESIAMAEYVWAHDRANPAATNQLGRMYLRTGRWDKALAASRSLLTLSPGHVNVHYRAGVALLQLGNAAAALPEMLAEPKEEFRTLGLIMVYHALGRKADSDAALATMIDKFGVEWAYNIGTVLAFRNEPEKAFAWLDKAIASRDVGALYIPSSKYLLKLHQDPRWLPMVRKMGAAPEQLAAIHLNYKLPQ